MNIATSGTYMIHKTEAEFGTTPKRVKPICGQSVSRSYLSVVAADNEEAMFASPITKTCKKCFNV